MNSLQQYLTYVSEQMGVNAPLSYSGRGMDGKSCVSISGSRRECMTLINEVIKLAIDEVSDFASEMDHEDEGDFQYLNTMRNELDKLTEDLLVNNSEDSMGHGIVMYWEMHEWAEDKED